MQVVTVKPPVKDLGEGKKTDDSQPAARPEPKQGTGVTPQGMPEVPF